MRVSLKWLKEILPGIESHYADLDNFIYTLDMTGTAVESVQFTGQALDKVVVGHILAKERHPNADTLWVTSVDVGSAADDGQALQIVCGADNFEAGDKVPVAMVGAVLPGDFKIKKSKLRGEVSMGMNCSARELGAGADADGLLILPADAPVGMPYAAYADLSDTILDLEITPNRPDCLSMQGIARELAAVFDLPSPVLDAANLANAISPMDGAVIEGDIDIHSLATVTVEDTDACPRYAARAITGVKIGPSPEWLVQRIEAAGVRSINNVVDATNYVMLLTGQPFHAFDLDTIAKEGERAHIIVRRATDGEIITTLDEVERKLSSENLLIADPSGPITLAGVMGAANTEVTDTTTNIFLEAAVFDKAITSRTSRGFQLISESSLRFERGVDSEVTMSALDSCAQLIADLAGGTVAAGAIDSYPHPYKRHTITVTLSRINTLLGTDLSGEVCEKILRDLQFELTAERSITMTTSDAVSTATDTDITFELTIPGFRDEVKRDVDLIEEILRLYGMENTPTTLPGGRERIGGLTPHQKLRRQLGQILRSCGLFETITLPFADLKDYENLYGSPDAAQDAHNFAMLHNPLSQDQSALRAQLLPSLLQSVATNRKRGTHNVQLYEDGTTFHAADGRKQPKEIETVCAVLCGAWNKPGWNMPAAELDFYDAKGIVETLLRQLGITRGRFVAPDDSAYPYLQPGRIAELQLGGRAIGYLGEVHPAVLARFDIDEPVVCFELECKPLFKAAKDLEEVVMPSKFPGIDFDIALLVDADVSAESISQRIQSFGKKTALSSVRLFDVYQGKGVPQGKKSLAFSLGYRADDRTLSAEEIEPQHEKILASLEKATGATLRS